MNKHIGFESWLERDHLMSFDFSPQVMAFSTQPFWRWWSVSRKKTRRHAPDVFVRLADGTALVVDVRPDGGIEPRDAEAFVVTEAACKSVGWSYRRVGALEPVWAANLHWLAGYRHARNLQALHRDQLLKQ